MGEGDPGRPHPARLTTGIRQNMTDHNDTSALQADVMIVGAGPVGLTLAMDLASRGVSVVICETRRFAEPPNVKCNHVA